MYNYKGIDVKDRMVIFWKDSCYKNLFSKKKLKVNVGIILYMPVG